ncbi:MAG TPA: c-type cytochrome [Thermoanaerobaculia bacterium]|nr:c-type cytochrome [Thermoanaerobaculia bacterium]
MRAALAFISVVVLALHAYVFNNQFFARWQDYQKKYFKDAAAASTNDAVRATLVARRPAIEQTIVRSFGSERIDRCQTCHIAADDPRFTKADQPLRTHPPVPGHRFETFGCTICHDGQGRAVDAEQAHGTEEWPWPVLPKTLIQSNCVQCHTQSDWPGAPLVNAGRRLFFERACYTCHTIAGLSYGSIGPELSEVGRRRRWEFVHAKIENPRWNNPTSTMPRQDLTNEQRMSLVAFLKAQQGAHISRAPLAKFQAAQAERPKWLPLGLIVGHDAEVAFAAQAPAQRGEALLQRVGCLSCHKLGERDGRVGPELAFTSAQRDDKWMLAHFRDPKSVVPGSLMPPYPLPDDIFDALSAYLLSRRPPEIPAEPEKRYAALCSRCHGEKGQGNGLIAEYLDPKPRDLTKAAFMRTKTRERLVASLVNGVPGTSMAPWGRILGGEAQAGALVDYVLSTWSKDSRAQVPKGRVIPAANPVAYSKESVERGEAIFLNRCWGCHGKKADGHGPNAEDIVPRPRNLRNAPFVASVSYTRLHESIKYGVQGTAMPAAGFDFSLDDKAIGDVVNYILSLTRPAPKGEPAKVAEFENTAGR